MKFLINAFAPRKFRTVVFNAFLLFFVANIITFSGLGDDGWAISIIVLAFVFVINLGFYIFSLFKKH